MQKGLIHGVLAASLLAGAAGCGTIDRLSASLPGVYRIDVKQGNEFDQTAIDRLQPGMAKSQVRFVLGTPMVEDPFHVDRWDYVYRFKPGSGEAESHWVSVYFEDERLVRVAGDFRPNPSAETLPVQKEQAIIVPPKTDDRSILRKTLDSIGGTDGV
ncbi:MAG: outer membrane protein assembly factor BamE [Chromatiales bacterium]|nr:outer membrane protein assembly factor BamE [Chromatiales bacterium]